MEAHREGNYGEAIRLQSDELEYLSQCGEDLSDARKLLSLFHYSANQPEQALELLQLLREEDADDVEVLENLGVIQRLMGRLDEAVDHLSAAYRLDPSRANVCDALAHCYSNLGDTEKSQRFGRLSLELKDQVAARTKPLAEIPEGRPAPFDSGNASANIISFSLWGSNPRYLHGAIRNARVAVDMYPGWTCRFSCDDSVPEPVLNELKRQGAQVVMKPKPDTFFDGLLWRFEVVGDPEVSRFLIRDCDSVLNVQERVAVDEWLLSERWFHCMRDFASHTEVILAGMWGGVGGVLPSLAELRKAFKPNTAPTRTFDQVLLRECVWPIVRKSVLIHDSVYKGCLGSVPFPSLGRLPEHFHVGQNEAAVRPELSVDLEQGSGETDEPLVILSGLDEEAIKCCAEVLEAGSDLKFSGHPDLSEIREHVRQFAEPYSEGGLEAELEAKFVELAVESFLQTPPVQREAKIGLLDCAGDVEMAMEISRRLNCKTLFVVRDPRDTASARRYADEESCRILAQAWKSQLKVLARESRSRSGQVEIVRYEDLSLDQRRSTIQRIGEFLDVNTSTGSYENDRCVDSGKPLPEELKKVIESEVGDLLKKLKY